MLMCGVGAKYVAHLMKFHLLQWEVVKVKWTKNGQLNRQNYINFESNLAMIVIYLPVKFEFDWAKRF